MKQLNKGIFITIEGIDGSGKSTLAKNLYESLKNEFPTILTKEPSDSLIGQQIRSILQKKISITKKTQYLLFAADRAEHFQKIIIPSLRENKIIISDRGADSSLAYQGYGNGLDIDIIKMVNSWSMNNTAPDYIFYLKIDPNIALDRVNKRNEDITEYENLEFLKKISHGFDEIFNNRKNIFKIDVTSKSQGEILQNVIEIFKAKILL